MNTYYNNFISFFKKHNLYNEEMFKYIQNNRTLFDYRDEEKRIFIGCYYICNKQGILQKINVCVPFIDNQITMLINIHEYIHAIELYKNIGKKYQQKDTEETLPMLYEQLYYLENPYKELERYLIELNNKITKNSSKSYQIALLIQEELLSYYQKTNPTFRKLQTKVKKLSKSYIKSNKI